MHHSLPKVYSTKCCMCTLKKIMLFLRYLAVTVCYCKLQINFGLTVHSVCLCWSSVFCHKAQPTTSPSPLFFSNRKLTESVRAYFPIGQQFVLMLAFKRTFVFFIFLLLNAIGAFSDIIVSLLRVLNTLKTLKVIQNVCHHNAVNNYIGYNKEQ